MKSINPAKARVATLAFTCALLLIHLNESKGQAELAAPSRQGPLPSTLSTLSEAESTLFREAIVARIATVETVRCSFDSQLKSSLPAWMVTALEKDDEQRAKIHPGVRSSKMVGECRITGSFSALVAHRRIRIDYPPETVQAAKELKWVPLAPQDWVVTPERTEWVVRGEGDPVGVIRTASRDIPPELNVDLGLGLREYATGRVLISEDWKKKAVSKDSHGNVAVQEIAPNNMMQEWLFSPEKGFALIQYRLYAGSIVQVTIECADFRNVGGVLLPHKITQSRFLGAVMGASPTLSVKTKISDYVIGGAENKASTYQMIWPRGSSFVDVRTNHQVDVNEPRSYTDADILKLAADKEKAKKGVEKRAQDLINSLRNEPLSPQQ